MSLNSVWNRRRVAAAADVCDKVVTHVLLAHSGLPICKHVHVFRHHDSSFFKCNDELDLVASESLTHFHGDNPNVLVCGYTDDLAYDINCVQCLTIVADDENWDLDEQDCWHGVEQGQYK